MRDFSTYGVDELPALALEERVLREVLTRRLTRRRPDAHDDPRRLLARRRLEAPRERCDSNSPSHTRR